MASSQVEFGRLLVISKEGNNAGGIFPITKDCTIGRDKACDIRIKLNSVSREHVKIVVDQNGNCILNHLSKTNQTLFNDTVLECSAVLKEDDKFILGERTFIFQSSK